MGPCLCVEPGVEDVESCERYQSRALEVALVHVVQLANH